ncbi:MAG: hypothetical protein GY756_02610 [bacterium]|nr:hypothetical protein [bacterium]
MKDRDNKNVNNYPYRTNCFIEGLGVIEVYNGLYGPTVFVTTDNHIIHHKIVDGVIHGISKNSRYDMNDVEYLPYYYETDAYKRQVERAGYTIEKLELKKKEIDDEIRMLKKYHEPPRR